MSVSPSLPGRYQIDVIDQVGRAYRVVLDHTQLVLEMALLPFVIVSAAQLVAVLLPHVGVFGTVFAGLVHLIGVLVFGTVFVVRWHRYVLLGEAVGDGLIPPGWFPFFIAGVKIAALVFAGWIVLVVIAKLPPHAITFPLVMIGGIGLGLLSLRVSLVFPAAAIEQPVPLRTASDWIRGNYWRLFACALGCYLPFLIVELIVGWLGGAFPSFLWIVFEGLRLAVSFAGAAVVAALLSHVYLAIVGGAPQSAE